MDLSESALNGVELSDVGSGLFRDAPGAVEPGSPGPGLVSTARFFQQLVERTLFAPAAARSAAAVVKESGSELGSCGGEMTYTVSADDGTGAFQASFTFKSFCEAGSVMNGSLTAGGEIDLVRQELEHMTMSFQSLTIADNSDQFSIGGTMSMDLRNLPTSTAVMNLSVRDDAEQKSFRFDDYRVTATELSGTTEVTVSGRVYHSDYGYVDIQTLQTFHVAWFDDNPSSGILEVAGAGNTKARMTALSSETLRIEADTNGDGVFDWDSGVLRWEDL
ncbi:MAG: hypothetical protein P1P84_11700 [Deferrisomatales bacterium]|nr:hypothetical protein [Deferrisomatales bacterium]